MQLLFQSFTYDGFFGAFVSIFISSIMVLSLGYGANYFETSKYRMAGWVIEPMNKVERGKLLVGLEKILNYSGISKHMFYEFVEIGLPAVLIKGKCYSHEDNPEEYFGALARKI